MYRRRDSTVTRLEPPICLTMARLLPILSAFFPGDELLNIVMDRCNCQQRLDIKQIFSKEYSILFFSREAPEAWLRNYLTSSHELQHPENSEYLGHPSFGYDFYRKLTTLIRNFAGETKETQNVIIDFIEDLAPEDDQEWNENLLELKDF